MVSFGLCYMFFLLPGVAQVTANVLIINDCYCEFELYRLENHRKIRLGTVFPRRTARFLGNLSVDFEMRWRNETMLGWTVPSHQPQHNAVQSKFDLSKDSFVPFHATVIAKDDVGEECSSPSVREPADIRMACIVLLVVICVLGVSMLSRSSSATKVELAGWGVVLALYYPVSILIVRRLSAEYDRHYTDLPGISTWNPKQGYRHSGLHRELLISSIFGGRPWDLKDPQFRDLVESSPYILSFVLVYLLIKNLSNRRFHAQMPRAFITLVVALLFVGFLHEAKLLLTLGIAVLNYLISIVLALAGLDSLIPVVSWSIGLSGLVASAEGGLTLQIVFGNLGGPAAARLGATLDGFKGELGWYTIFNFVVLRMISWSCDFSRHLRAPAEDASKAEQDVDLGEDARVETHRSDKEYRSLVLYLSYIFYPPLYLTGPIITFNAFASYLAKPQQICIGTNLCLYALRWSLNTVLLVACGHFIYTFAIMMNGDRNLWPLDGSTVFEFIFAFGQDGEGMVWYSYWTLKVIWLKFLVIWRFARLWALLDGVCPPENMNRCMSNNYTVRGFWRAWHRSFNRWLVRYIFVPLGGSRKASVFRRLMTVLTVFMFVVFWHEPVLLQRDWAMVRVLAWGLLMTLFMAPEVIVERVCSTAFVQSAFAKYPLIARHLKALGGALCIEMLMLANLIGYAYGIHGAKALLETCGRLRMVVFLLAYTMWLFAGAQVMMVIRQREICKVAAKNF